MTLPTTTTPGGEPDDFFDDAPSNPEEMDAELLEFGPVETTETELDAAAVLEEGAAPVDPTPAPALAPAPGAPAPAPAPQPVVTPAPVATPAQPEPLPQQAGTPQAGTPQLPSLHELIATRGPELIDALAKSPAFALTPEQTELFEDPRIAEFVSRREAALYLKTMAALSNVVTHTLPNVVHNVIGVLQTRDSYEATFFEQYPELKDHQPVLRTLLGALRTAEPNLAVPDLMTRLGTMARAYLNLPGSPAPAAGNGNVPPRAPRGATAKPSQPFVPAQKVSGKAGAPKVAPTQDADPFAFLSDMLRSS